jgi:uncharacterized membrane protein YeaQ/YmgE (transglycosylase-associated protein family)
MDIALFIVIGIAVGWIACVLMETKGMGLWASVGMGAAGGLVGGLVFKVVVAIVQALVPHIAALVGALVAVMGGRQFMRKRRRTLP